MLTCYYIQIRIIFDLINNMELKKMKILMGVLVAMGIISGTAAAQNVQKLPDPVKTGGMPLMEALAARKTSRDFTNKEIDNQTLSEILWSAYGISHGDDLRTIPTAQNKKDLEVYVVKADGIWKYDADNNAIIEVNKDNHLPEFQQQDYMKNVPVVLVYVGNSADNYAPMHAGSAYQNVGLYAASKNLKNVVRGYFDKKLAKRSLKLPREKEAIISQAIGW